MNTMLKYGCAAILAAGSVLATGAPALAQPHVGGGAFHGGGFNHGGFAGGHGYGGYRGYGYGRGWGGYGVGVGLGALTGLAIGAAVAPGYYGDLPCYTTREVWNPYAGAYVVQQVPYPC